MFHEDVDADSARPVDDTVQAGTGRSDSHSQPLRDAPSARKSLGDHVDDLFSKILGLEQELKSIRSQRAESAKKLGECLDHCKLLNSEFVEKSQRTVSLIESLETAQSDPDSFQDTVSNIRDIFDEQFEICTPLLACLTESLKGLRQDGGASLHDNSERALGELNAAELQKMQRKLRKCEEVIYNSLKNCKVFANAFDLSIDPNLNLTEFVATMMQSLQAQWGSKEAALQQKNAALAKLREDVQKAMHELKAQLEKRDKSLRG